MNAQYVEAIGFLAAGMTVVAFGCKHMLLLRLAAIAANLLFIAYGGLLGLLPVLALHCILLPLNVARLLEFIAEEKRRDASGRAWRLPVATGGEAASQPTVVSLESRRR